MVREKHLEARALVGVLRALAPRLRLIVHAQCADGEAVARAGGWGLHLPGGVDVGAVRARFDGLLGYSAHSLTDAVYARDAGADYALISPVWRPGSKVGDRRKTLGVAGAVRAQKAAAIPLFALGGMTPERAEKCIRAGLYGVAGIGGFFGGEAPEAIAHAVQSFVAVLPSQGHLFR